SQPPLQQPPHALRNELLKTLPQNPEATPRRNHLNPPNATPPLQHDELGLELVLLRLRQLLGLVACHRGSVATDSTGDPASVRMVRSRKEDRDEGRLETKEARQESAAEVAEGEAQREARGVEEVRIDLAPRRVRPGCRRLGA